MEIKVRSSRSIITLLFFIFFLIFFLLQVLGPLFLPSGSVKDLSGLTFISDNEENIDDMPIPWNIIYSAGDKLCHQRNDRSFFINENQMPFCARCTAIWLGIAIGLGLMLFFRIPLDEKFLFVIIIGVIPIAIDGLGQLFNFWESTNLTRVITGLLIGVITGVSLGIIIDELKMLKKSKTN